MSMMVDFQAYAGPGDRAFRNNELEGYQPVSRIGEVVMNSFGTRLCSNPLLQTAHSFCTILTGASLSQLTRTSTHS